MPEQEGPPTSSEIVFFQGEDAKKLALEEYDKFERRRLHEDALAPDPFDEPANQLKETK